MAGSSSAAVLVLFGAAVRTHRRDRGWSQEEFADRVGIHRTYIGAIERGEQNVCLVNISRIAEALGVSLAALFGAAEQSGPAR
jgi:transcriptional regulator with XRE-family HTH domain